MKTVIVNQARLGSTRLPGKIFKEVLGKTLLEYQLERLRRVKRADDMIIATTTREHDTALADFCSQRRISCYRGSEEDVLNRYVGAGLQSGAEVIVRVTSDCPLIDPSVLDQVIAFYHENSSRYDYVSNTLERRFPRGLDCEVFSRRLLQDLLTQDLSATDHEHVTAFIYRHPERYRLGNVGYPDDYSHHRWTVDTAEDFDLIRRILEDVYPRHPEFSWLECLSAVEKHPEWGHLNNHVKQRMIL